MKKRLPLIGIILALVIATMVFLNITTEEYPQVVAVDAQTINAPELHKRVNEERTKLGIASLKRDRQLDKSAIEKCRDIASRNYWSHNTPEGTPPWVLIKKYYPNYQKAGENEAYGFNNSAEMVEGWMKSPTHKENIVDSKYTLVGYGVCKSDNFLSQGKQTIAIQHFAQP